MDKKYHDLFALYHRESPAVFWNTVQKTGKEKLNFKVVFQYLNSRSYADPAERLLLTFPKEQLEYDFLIASSKSKTIKRRARNCARMLLMEHFPEKLKCADIFHFLESKEVFIQEKAKELLNKLQAKDFSFTFLSKKLHANNLVVVREAQMLLIKHFSERLNYKTLFSFFEVGSGICHGASALLDVYSVDRLDPMVFFEYLRSKRKHARNSAMRILLRCAKEQYHFDVLVSHLKTNNEYVKDALRRILLKHFSENVEYRILLSFLFSKNSAVRNQTGKILLKRFPEKMSINILRRLVLVTTHSANAEAYELFEERYPDDEIILYGVIDEKVVKQFTS